MIWELPRELMQAGEHGRKGEKGKLAGESHKTRLRCLECRQSYQVSVATGMSPWLHCVQEGWGRPTLRRPSWAVLLGSPECLGVAAVTWMLGGAGNLP